MAWTVAARGRAEPVPAAGAARRRQEDHGRRRRRATAVVIVAGVTGAKVATASRVLTTVKARANAELDAARAQSV
ncbi:hypothetical protein HRW23_28545 [Streptomyces lunaelactis]|uniref:hypothetical protein n=1 Tax=Streptomyces lunaelactis TaxID=1535768 RepID=UPI0015856FB5|nr:hypothetical protein [Streptomyces lunaelactis]NUK26815.1 hypothetical protein [Streptomyces lunaelactis]NUK61502.1 hypothetical protein [Streptomyces lunaelactis]NUK72092.1 hypothetical protein [Streptomyces lunaelactis]NUK81264.1 hypothetical protein [Streptomyces lunaelactis]